MQAIGNILKERIEAYSRNPREVEQWHKQQGVEYNKRWANGVQHFQIAINKDRKKDGLKPITFMAVRQKLVALKEIDDLKWFLVVCTKYAKTKDRFGKQNTFSRCFFGSLRIQ